MIKNLFSETNPINRFFSALGDIIIINLLFLLCSLPIVTLGASYSAMYYAFLKKFRMSDTSVVKNFFHGFRENAKKATLTWVAVLLFLLVLWADIGAFSPGGVMPFAPFFYLILILACIIGFVLIYLFPVIATFENTLKNLVIQSLLLAGKNLPYTLLLAILQAVPVYLTFRGGQIYLWALVLWTILGFGLIAYVSSRILLHIFTPYLPAVEPIEDPWE